MWTSSGRVRLGRSYVLVTGNDIDEVVFDRRRLRVLAIHSGHSEPAASRPLTAPSTAVSAGTVTRRAADRRELDDADHVALSRLEPMLETAP